MNILTEITIVGIIGMILQMLMKARSIQNKAKLSNVQFRFWDYFVDDWLSHLISLGGDCFICLPDSKKVRFCPGEYV